MRSLSFLLITVLMAGGAPLAAGQTAGQAAKSTAAAAAAAPKALKIGPVTVAGSLRTRLELWDWFEGDGNNSYGYLGNLLRVSLGQSKKTWDWQVELAVPVLLGLPDDAIAPGTQGQLGLGATYFASNDRSRNAAMVFPKQGFVRFKGLGGVEGQSLRLGRMEVIDGSEVVPGNATLAAVKRDRIAHRLLGNFGFSHVGRSFDGAQYALNKRKLNLTLFGGRPTRGVFQVDGWGELDINTYYGALTGQLAAGKGAGEWRVFGLGYSDYRDGVLKTDNRVTAVRRADTEHINIGTFGGHYIHSAPTSAGDFDFLLWGAAQTGSWGRLSHRAYAGAAEMGFQPNIVPRLRPWIRAGYNYGSGDESAEDGAHGSFFQVLPTPRVYARFPFFNMMNSADAFGELILRPHRRLTLRTDWHALRLASKQDLWYLGGGAYQPWTFGYTGRAAANSGGLAMLLDVSADYAVNANLALAGYAGHASGRSMIETIYPKGKNGNFGYLELTWRF
jgi:hypothetical protein